MRGDWILKGERFVPILKEGCGGEIMPWKVLKSAKLGSELKFWTYGYPKYGFLRVSKPLGSNKIYIAHKFCSE
jgi:hypothetical protein